MAALGSSGGGWQTADAAAQMPFDVPTHSALGPLRLQVRFPEYAFEDGEAGEPQPSINNSRVQQELGLAITPVQETLLDMAATLIALGLAQPQRKA